MGPATGLHLGVSAKALDEPAYSAICAKKRVVEAEVRLVGARRLDSSRMGAPC